jgi:hypothetical protein
MRGLDLVPGGMVEFHYLKTGARGAGLRGWGGSLTDRTNLTRVMPA